MELVCTELLLVELGVADAVREAPDGEADGLEEIEEKPLLISAVPEKGACAPELSDDVKEDEEESAGAEVGAKVDGAGVGGWVVALPVVLLSVGATPGATSGAAASVVSGSSLGVLLSPLALGAAGGSCVGAIVETGSAIAGGVSFWAGPAGTSTTVSVFACANKRPDRGT